MNDRKHLTEGEFDHLLAAVKRGRNEARDRCLLLLMFRHGLRVSEAWLAERARMKPARKAFVVSEQRTPLHRSTVNLALKKYGELAALPVSVRPHILRHACGFALTDQAADTRLIQDYLGHRNIQHTVRYTAINRARFERLRR
jgi:type 1 fimbriae regulatory protein FimB